MGEGGASRGEVIPVALSLGIFGVHHSWRTTLVQYYLKPSPHSGVPKAARKR